MGCTHKRQTLANNWNTSHISQKCGCAHIISVYSSPVLIINFHQCYLSLSGDVLEAMEEYFRCRSCWWRTGSFPTTVIFSQMKLYTLFMEPTIPEKLDFCWIWRYCIHCMIELRSLSVSWCDVWHCTDFTGAVQGLWCFLRASCWFSDNVAAAMTLHFY